MLDLYLTPRANQDLVEIYQYTFKKWGLQQADHYQDELYHGMQMILSNVSIGKRYTYHNQAYRKLHINKHLIFYRTERNDCLVVRILHDRMDIKSHFAK